MRITIKKVALCIMGVACFFVSALPVLAAPTITITSPNGGETLEVGKTYHITWNATNADQVSIGFSACASCLDFIANNIPNTGSYNWTVNVGNTINTKFKIYILAGQTGVGTAADYSDADFTVTSASGQAGAPLTSPGSYTAGGPSIKITSPNGGESWLPGSTHSIMWSQKDVSTVFLEHTMTQGNSTRIVSSLSVDPKATQGSYEWTIPSNIPLSNNYRMSIIGYGGTGSGNDESDAVFSIVAPPVQSRPDLVISDFKASPEIITGGFATLIGKEEKRFDATVQNKGSANIVGEIESTWTITPNPYSQNSVPNLPISQITSLKKGESRVISFIVPSYDYRPGTYRATLVLDPLNKIVEADESNNTVSLDFAAPTPSGTSAVPSAGLTIPPDSSQTSLQRTENLQMLIKLLTQLLALLLSQPGIAR